jgi:hypothetical protein
MLIPPQKRSVRLLISFVGTTAYMHAMHGNAGLTCAAAVVVAADVTAIAAALGLRLTRA